MEKQRFWFGAFIATLGVVMMFVAMFMDPQGHISSSVLTAAGEVLVFAGAILGLDGYMNFKIKKLYEADKFSKKEDDGIDAD